MVRLVLASASPRRAELLAAAGFRFEVTVSDVDETPHGGESPRDYALRVACDKARAVARAGRPDCAILAADTVVVAGGRMLGKPSGSSEAREMLRMLSGSVHEVLTAVVFLGAQDPAFPVDCARDPGKLETAEIETTRVRFVPLSHDEIDWYVRTGEPQGKAGAYAIQGHAARFVDRIEGSWSNVVGLPVATVYRILKDAGVLCWDNSGSYRDL